MNKTARIPDRKRRRNQKKGHIAENLAAMFLMLKGYKILARRYKTHAGEIDLIARRGNRVIFVEVKARSKLEDGLWAVSPFQQQRIRRAAESWLAHKPEYSNKELQFDVIVIAPFKFPRHITQAF